MTHSYRRGSAAGGSLKRSTGLMKLKHMDAVVAFRSDLEAAQAAEIERQRAADNAECAALRDLMIPLMGHEAYGAWWDAAPEHGFLAAARAKYAELVAAQPAPKPIATLYAQYAPKPLVYADPATCVHAKEFAAFSGMCCRNCHRVREPQNDFETGLVRRARGDSYGSSYVNYRGR